MTKEKYCPVCGENCKKEVCAWCSKTFEKCTMHCVGESLTELMIMADDKGITVTYVDD